MIFGYVLGKWLWAESRWSACWWRAGTRENRDSGGVINRVASTGNASGSIGNPGAGNPGTQTEGDGELKDLPNNVGPAGKGSGKGQSSDTGK